MSPTSASPPSPKKIHKKNHPQKTPGRPTGSPQRGNDREPRPRHFPPPCNPVGVDGIVASQSQGSSFLATLGFMTLPLRGKFHRGLPRRQRPPLGRLLDRPSPGETPPRPATRQRPPPRHSSRWSPAGGNSTSACHPPKATPSALFSMVPRRGKLRLGLPLANGHLGTLLDGPPSGEIPPRPATHQRPPPRHSSRWSPAGGNSASFCHNVAMAYSPGREAALGLWRPISQPQRGCIVAGSSPHRRDYHLPRKNPSSRIQIRVGPAARGDFR